MSRPGLSEVATRWRKDRDLQAVLGAVVFIALGIGVVWFVKNHVGIKGDAVLISVLLLPALLYLAISGRLSEISGPGGVGAKFRATGAAPVHGDIQPTIDLQEVPKGGPQLLQTLRPHLADGRPRVLTFKLDGTAFFTPVMVREYMALLGATRGANLVAFVGADDRVHGYMRAERFAALVRADAAGEMVQRLNAPDAAQQLALLPGVVTKSLTVGTSNTEALRIMTDYRLNVALIVDRDGHIAGVIERVQLISTMLLAAAPQ